MFSFSQTLLKILIFITALTIGADRVGAHGKFRMRMAGAQARTIEEMKEAVKDIQEQLREKRLEFGSYLKKEAETLSSLQEIDLSLNHARKVLHEAQSRLQILEREMEATRLAADGLSLKIRDMERYAASRMVSLYKLNALGPGTVVAGAASATDFITRRMALTKILRHDHQILNELADRQKMFGDLMQRLEKQKSEQAILKLAEEQQARVLIHQQEQRKKLLSDIRSEKKMTEAAINSLKNAAAELDRRIDQFYKEAVERENARKEPARKGTFLSSKGLLNMPVVGKIVSFFGPYKNPEYGVMNFQSGLEIQSERGRPIRSVWEGEVIFSSWFTGYGNMIIVDHGDHYYTVYAHAEQLLKAKGDRVEAGETIGTVGDSGSLGGPGLHFEVRHHGKPVNPLNWLKKG